MKLKSLLFLLFPVMFSCGSKTSTNVTGTSEVMDAPAPIKSGISGYRDLDTEAFKTAVMNAKDPVIIDVRTPKEIASGKLNGAIELDFYDSSFGEEILKMDKSKPYFIYCASGIRSAKTCRMMVENGFKDVVNLKAGYIAYKE